MAFIPLKPIPIKDRNSMIFIGMGRIDVKDNAFVVIDEVNGERMHIPVGSLARLKLLPPIALLLTGKSELLAVKNSGQTKF
ncbi:hypothetical protein [Xenorhabdus bakwenae]|uniref:hypothetical protein n=1 Tax=Xenorhabdus bakwenae TaxID=3026967 RepID=UPI003D9FE469